MNVKAWSGFSDYSRHVNPVLGEFLKLSGRDQRFVQATGCTLITEEGEEFADWIAGFGSVNLGHNPPELLQKIDRHLKENPPNLYPESLNPYSGQLAKELVRLAGSHFETCFFSNSGSEAVESAIKTAIAATGRKTVLFCEGAYHGTTLGALSLMGDGHYRKQFEPLLPYESIPFNNIDALAQSLETIKPCAFILEPVQVESGFRSCLPNFLQQASAICHDSGALLILDEVQTGMGRTGKLFAFEHANVRPDILVLGKALGGGLLPIGATLFREGLFRKAYGNFLSCEAHNSTFGGNALTCTVAMEVLRILGDSDFLQNVQSRSFHLQSLLEQHLRNHPLVERIYLQGLLGGITLREVDHPWFSWKSFGLEGLDHLPVTGPLLVHRMHRRKFLTQICAHHWNTLRIEPPLIVSPGECERFVSALSEELNWIVSNS
ncbi:aminotransferase class III-fold pyridoxal phosphate-dependent enzyme [bacterium]|nr:aminotransferase class III-fold pyridoxal phosphate-dependent enzyme [bacterium]